MPSLLSFFETAQTATVMPWDLWSMVRPLRTVVADERPPGRHEDWVSETWSSTLNSPGLAKDYYSRACVVPYCSA